MMRLFLIFALLLSACSRQEQVAAPAPQKASPPPSIEAIADTYVADYLSRYPTAPTAFGLPNYRHDRLTDMSPEAIAEWQRVQDETLATLEAVGRPDDVGSRDWLTYGILYEELKSAVGTRICKQHLWSASTTTAWYNSLPFVFDYQPLKTEENLQDALLRLAALGPYIDQNIENLREGLELGYSAPRVTVEKVPEQVRALLEDKNPFLGMGARALNKGFANDVQSIFEVVVAPAIERYASFIENEYLPTAREKIALSENPDGEKCYPALVRSFASIEPSADEIHELGLEQMAKIQQQFREVINEHFEGVPTAQLLRTINSDPSYTFASEDEVLQYSIDALDEAKAAMPRAFGRLPRADVIIKPYPDFAASGVGSYQSPPEDGSRPGIFWIAVIEPETRTRATQKSTLYHETWPGHHLQGAIALELGDRVHDVARYFGNSGFSEGWALYSERVAEELGLYENPIDVIGLLSDQGARAARLVIDTGLHTRGWTRKQAVDYMLANTGWAESDIQNDVNRYISWPGQANAYMLGMLEIQRLRRQAESTLGEDFDLREFHDRLLESGGVTLPMLEQVIAAWIATPRPSPGEVDETADQVPAEQK